MLSASQVLRRLLQHDILFALLLWHKGDLKIWMSEKEKIYVQIYVFKLYILYAKGKSNMIKRNSAQYIYDVKQVSFYFVALFIVCTF